MNENKPCILADIYAMIAPDCISLHPIQLIKGGNLNIVVAQIGGKNCLTIIYLTSAISRTEGPNITVNLDTHKSCSPDRTVDFPHGTSAGVKISVC